MSAMTPLQRCARRLLSSIDVCREFVRDGDVDFDAARLAYAVGPRTDRETAIGIIAWSILEPGHRVCLHDVLGELSPDDVLLVAGALALTHQRADERQVA